MNGWVETEYKGKTYRVPITGPDHSLDAALTEIPDDDHAMAYLMQDGNLGVPGGRYGSDTKTCAPIAIILGKIMQHANGEPLNYWQLHSDMGFVVNSSDAVAYSLRQYGEMVGVDPADYLDGDDLHFDLDHYNETGEMIVKNLRYQKVTLFVPYRENEGMKKPEDWDWMEVADTDAPVWVTDAEDLPKLDAVETLQVNGFGELGDLADQVADDK